MANKIFPIQTATSCQLKWAWSTVSLNTGVTKSCHRTATSELTPDNFFNFHNTEVKMQDRRDMLEGKWPETNCQYCKSVESSGGVSDRIRQMSVPYSVPPELEQNPSAIKISPTLLEVYFNNTCNLGCLYCIPSLSSTIFSENQTNGEFNYKGVLLKNPTTYYKDLAPYFWDWFAKNFSTLSRLQILGGEPLYQKELDKLLDMIDRYPNPQCELSVITNLTVSPDKLQSFVEKCKSLLSQKKLKRIDITCSIDCWGTQQEYVRWPLNLELWEKNFEYLLSQKYLYVSINQTISVLTIKTMPSLLIKLSEWRKSRKIGHWFSEVDPGPTYLKPYILGGKTFQADFEEILSLMPADTEENINGYNYMKGIATHIASHNPHLEEIQNMFVFLNEKDRRRNTDWRVVFPWLKEFESYVV